LTTRFGETISEAGFSARGDQKLEALKLYQGGMTQKDAAATVGLHRSTVFRLIKKHGAHTILPGRSCAKCGKSLAGMTRLNQRTYCSKECRYHVQYARKHPDRERIPVNHERRKKGLELYWGGLDSGSIARHLDVSKKTVKSWILRYGKQKERKVCPHIMALRPLRHRLNDARTADEWAKILEEAADDSNILQVNSIHLVCGAVYGSGAAGRYASFVVDIFAGDLVDGMRFAFCNILQDTVSTIEWRNGNFRLTRTLKSSGSFVWPSKELGISIPLSDTAFKHLLSFQISKYSLRNH